MSRTSFKSPNVHTPLQKNFTQLPYDEYSRHLELLSRKQLETRIKPFGFCCSVDRFDPLSRYDRRIPPYKRSSPTAVTTLQECPVTKLQVEFLAPKIREKKRPLRVKSSEEKDQLLKNFQIDQSNRSLRWFVEDEIALAKSVFWTGKQRLYHEAGDKAIAVAKGRREIIAAIDNLQQVKYPRWYQDFSPRQMESLMNLESTMHDDYESATTTGTQAKLMDIGVASAFFKLKPNVVRELYKSCKLDGVRFLREIYKILTGSDFQEEAYKKVYDCNERIILSAIAFLTLPETIMELHKRLPPVVMPRLSPKPQPPTYPARRRSSCPYTEELFRRPDWTSYRNNLQRWQKRRRLLPIPRVLLPLKNGQLSVSDETPKIISTSTSKITKKEKDRDFKRTNTKELQPVSQKDAKANIDRQATHGNEGSAGERIPDTEKSGAFDVPRLSHESKKFDFRITGLGEKPGAVEYKICGTLKPPGSSKKSWLGEKTPHYVIAGASEDPPSCPVTYEITGVANVTPSNSDEKFFAVLKLGNGPRKIFPAGRERLSRNWQEWLRNADEEFRRMERQADELIRSVQATMKLISESVCDNCCSCRQTRKTRDKLRRTKTPYLVIDNMLSNGGENKYIVGSIALHSPAPSLTESEVNLLEIVASQDELQTNIIINGVTNENGKTQYYISGTQKDEVRVPSRVLHSSQPISPQLTNVPPCACIIRQMFNKDVSASASKDDIPWTKDDGLCPGKKYRPDELGAYSCKMYPGDKSCRRNPFIKEITKLKRKREEEEEEDSDKKKTKYNGMTEEQSQEEKVAKKEKEKFIPDLNYPAYDDPWNISRTAPSARTLVTDYEKSLKLTPPVFPAVFSPFATAKTQEGQKISLASKEPKKLGKEITVKRIVEGNSQKISKSSKKIYGRKNTEKYVEGTKKKKKNGTAPSAQISANEKDAKLPNRNTFQDMGMNKMPKGQREPSLVDRSAVRQQQQQQQQQQQFNRVVNKIRKRASVKKNSRKNVTSNNEKLNDRKREIEKLKKMLKSYARFLPDVQPAILPWERPALPPVEQEISVDEEEKRRTGQRETYGWRTKSEQELPAKKTLAYLCEPDYPLETVAVRPGGRLCRCRENRSKKKILMYNVSGMMNGNKCRQARKDGGMRRLDEGNRIIDGVTYYTPPVSPRRSDEYIPEYELVESPYDTCVGDPTDQSRELAEGESDRETEKIRRKFEACSCVNAIADVKGDVGEKKEIERVRQELMKSKSPEERWEIALKDEALMDHFTKSRRKRNVRLKVVKPVCECRYERKIVERNEERAAWRARQEKLKAALKKQPFMHIVDTSRPMVPDTKLIISEVKRISQENEEDPEDIKYCITGIAETLTMSSGEQIVDGLKMSTPVVTPEPSKEDILRDVVLQWGPRKIPPGPKPRQDAILKEEMARRRKARDEAFRMIYGDENEQDRRCSLECRDCRKTHSEKELVSRTGENNQPEKISTSVKQKEANAIIGQPSKPAKKSGVHVKIPQNISPDRIIQVAREKKKHSEEVSGGTGQDSLYNRTIGKTKEKNIGEKHRVNGDDDRKQPAGQLDLMTIMKNELKKMAEEGYIFAKLPKCYLMPQLKDWIMYRKGVIFSKADKIKLMRNTIALWGQIDVMPSPKIEPLSLHMTKRQLKKLTYDRAEEMKEKIKNIKTIFYSEVRKSRVLHARLMWSTMEIGKFPSALFKKAFFTYLASKEADGHVYKPWLRNEVRQRDEEFNCYVTTVDTKAHHSP